MISLPVDVWIGSVEMVGSAEGDKGQDRVHAARDHRGVGGRLLQCLPRPARHDNALTQADATNVQEHGSETHSTTSSTE